MIQRRLSLRETEQEAVIPVLVRLSVIELYLTHPINLFVTKSLRSPILLFGVSDRISSNSHYILLWSCILHADES